MTTQTVKLNADSYFYGFSLTGLLSQN